MSKCSRLKTQILTSLQVWLVLICCHSTLFIAEKEPQDKEKKVILSSYLNLRVCVVVFIISTRFCCCCVYLSLLCFLLYYKKSHTLWGQDRFLNGDTPIMLDVSVINAVSFAVLTYSDGKE